MSKRLEGGYLGGRPTWSLASNPGIWAIEQVYARRAAGTWPVGAGTFDEYYEYVTFMLHANGANASTSFPDSSLYGRSLSVFGNAQVSTAQSKFGGASIAFDGNGDYLSVPSSTALDFQSGDYTIELWVRFNSVGSFQTILSRYQTWATVVQFYLELTTSSTIKYRAGNNIPVSVTSGTAVAANTWYHVAITCSSGITRLFINGQLEASTGTAAVLSSDQPLGIGYELSGNTAYLNGYIDDLRITKGYARYTSNFSVPTGPYEDEGAPLADPFYNSVSLLLPLNGSNNSTTFTDRSSGARTVTPSGDAKLSTADKRYGVSSAYFDGTGDFLTIADANSGFSFGTGDFTYEWWFKSNATNNYAAMLTRPYSGAGGILISLNGATGDGAPEVYWREWTNGLFFKSSITGLNDNKWHHFAFVRSGTTVYMFIDGVQAASKASVSTSVGSSSVIIGQDIEYAGRTYTGYIDDVRITKGVARYVANFIPPLPHADYGTLADPYLGATTLLMPMEGPNNSTGFFDRADRLPVTTYGNAKISNAQYKWGLTSGYFDGTGDYLDLGNPSAVRLAANDFTFELWIHPTSSETEFVYWNADNSTAYAALRLNTTGGLLYVLLSTTGSSWAINSAAGTVTLNRWSHVAISRSGTTLRVFINGLQTFSGSISGSLMTSGTANILGARTYSPSLTYFTGYMDDVRLLLGHGAYTTNFTPPTAPINADTSSDPYLSNVSLLLKMDGANNSTTFTDSSLTPKAVFANGDAKISTAQSKFGGSSALFDGTGDYLFIASGNAHVLDGDFTIEFWLYASNSNSNQGVMSNGASSFSGTAFTIVFNHPSFVNQVSIWNYPSRTSTAVCSTGTLSAGTWNHVAFTRSQSTVTAYLNGIAGTNFATAGTFNLSATELRIGTYWNGSINGYIDDLRVTKGVARYTANFLPPTISHPVWSETDASFSSVSLLLNGNGANASTVVADRSSNGLTLVPNGNAQISTTQSRFGGSSLYFDGTGDYLTCTSSNAFLLGSSDNFTIEAWVYANSTAGTGVKILASTCLDYNTNFLNRWLLGISGNSLFWLGSDGNAAIIDASAFPVGQWVHVAAVRNAGVISLYKAGSSLGTQTLNQQYTTDAQLSVGFIPNALAFNGYIDDLRITKGVARYTATFTPPVAPLPIPVIDTNFGAVSLLLHMNGANASTYFPDHSYNALAVTANGNAQISTAQSKFGGASAYFDGNGDYLTIPAGTHFAFGSADFTVELWLYKAASGSMAILDVEAVGAFGFAVNDTQVISYSTNGASFTVTYSIPLNTWTHIAYSRSGTTLGLFINGSQIGSNTDSYSYTSTNALNIGRNPGSNSAFLNGYIDSLRITKGIARYTANFTPPTTQFPNS